MLYEVITDALKHEPDYSCLDSLQHDVWRKVRMSESPIRAAFHIPVFLKVGTLALCCLALLAVSQIIV